MRTFLRLASSTQREMARRWFLGPLPALTRAFELGWEAAQRGDQPSAALAAAALRDELLALAPTFGGTFPDDSLEEDTADSLDGLVRRDSSWESSDIDASDDPPTLEIDAASAPPAEARPPEPDDDDLVARSATWLIVDASQLRPSGWSGRALRDAARESIAQVPVEWLTGYDAVPPDELRAFARARRWNLRPERIYAARQHRGALYLIAASVSRDSGLVDRCAKVRPGDGLTYS